MRDRLILKRVAHYVIDKVSRAHVVGTEEAFQSGAACELGRFEGGPAAEAVAKDRGIFLGKPLQHLWKVVFE